MIYSVKGKLITKKDDFFAVEVGGLAFKIAASFNVLKSLPQIGQEVNIFTYLNVRENSLELYGFLNEEELRLFEMLVSISGIGPKSAIGILSVEKLEKLKAAIIEGRSELLTKSSGIGKKTAERVILELRNKLKQAGSDKIVGLMESDGDIIEALSNLGYTKYQAKEALSRVSSKITKMEERIKEALNILRSK